MVEQEGMPTFRLEGMPVVDDYPEVLTVQQTAEFLQLSDTHVLKMLKKGNLPGRKVGGVWRVSKRQLMEYIEGRGEEASQQ